MDAPVTGPPKSASRPDGRSDRDGGCSADGPRVGRDGHDHEHQKSRQEKLVRERRPRVDRRDGCSEIGRRPIPGQPEDHRPGNGPEQLGGDVDGGVSDREVARRGEGDGDRRVDVGAREVTSGVDHREDDQTEDGGDPDRTERLVTLCVDDDRTAAGEHECERRHALGQSTAREPRPRQEDQRRASGRARRCRRGSHEPREDPGRRDRRAPSPRIAYQGRSGTHRRSPS